MAKLEAQIKELLSRAGLKKGNIARLVVSIAIPVVFFFGSYLVGSYFFEGIWITNGILLGVILAIVAVIAGFAVIKSLFLVAGELSLLIFLSQSYCAVPVRGVLDDAALRSLLILGFLYIAFTFVGSLYKISKENYEKFEEDRWSVEKVITVGLFLILIGSFIWEIYLVVKPIILSLCVYQ